jgi:hypothetical protein
MSKAVNLLKVSSFDAVRLLREVLYGHFALNWVT